MCGENNVRTRNFEQSLLESADGHVVCKAQLHMLVPSWLTFNLFILVSRPNEAVQPPEQWTEMARTHTCPQNYFPSLGYKYLRLIVLDTLHANRAGSPGAH